MYVVTQEQSPRSSPVYAAETTDEDGFAIDAWTRIITYALTFTTEADAHDCLVGRLNKGHHMQGQLLFIREIDDLVRRDPMNIYLWRAKELGKEHGENAVESWEQENIGGRSTKNTETVHQLARHVLGMMESGDPALYDGIPGPDLSGEWADGMTPSKLIGEVGASVGYNIDLLDSDNICDEYEAAFLAAVTDGVTKACEGVLQ